MAQKILNLSNHRSFFTFIFTTLSVILLAVTLGAIQQQQITQSKASVDICQIANCNVPVGSGTHCRGGAPPSSQADWQRALCCTLTDGADNSTVCTKSSVTRTCKDINNWGTNKRDEKCKAFSRYCVWGNYGCVDKITVGTPTACKTVGKRFNLAEYPQGSINSKNNIPCCKGLIRQMDTGSTIRGICMDIKNTK